MNKEWSQSNKAIQTLLKKEETFDTGIQQVLVLRKQLISVMREFQTTIDEGQFSLMPFANAKGFHSKSVAYSLYHVFRIEDIVLNVLILNKSDLFTVENYKEKLNSLIITTGNELSADEISNFSSMLDIKRLYEYINAVDDNTSKWLRVLTFSDLKYRIPNEHVINLRSMGVVSPDENAKWLIDYWSKKTVLGLILMPFTRHWIMHTEASLRVISKIKNNSIRK